MPYTDNEVAILFGGLKFGLKPETHSHNMTLPWVMLITLYSGMRLEEVAEVPAAHFLDCLLLRYAIWRCDSEQAFCPFRLTSNGSPQY